MRYRTKYSKKTYKDRKTVTVTIVNDACSVVRLQIPLHATRDKGRFASCYSLLVKDDFLQVVYKLHSFLH